MVRFFIFALNWKEETMLPKIFIGLMLSVFVLLVNSYALPFTGSVLGEWTDIVSTDVLDISSIDNDDADGPSVFNWGMPATTDFDNQFSFDGYSFSDVEESTPFSIGSFSYRNGSTYFSSGIEGVDLSLELEFSDPEITARTFNFGFMITNTINSTGDAVLDGDIVSVTNTYTPTTFNYSGIEYTLNLLGFSSDEGTTIRTDFSSAEGAVQEAQLYAQITSDIQSIPEPGIFSLLALGLLTLGGTALTRRKK
jgi:hypothetical protein